MKIAILTDSGANLLPEYQRNHPNLFVVPLMIMIDGAEYRDQVEISAHEIYEKIDTHHITSSLPSLSDFENTINEIISKGYTHVVAINISSGLSGTYNAFRLAFSKVKNLTVLHYDSKTLAGGLGYLVEGALELVEQSADFSTFKSKLDQIRYQDTVAMYTINTLKYLRKGGRIGKVEGTIGDILHIKPVITVNDDGVYVTLSKGFGLNRSLIFMKNYLEEKFKQDLIDINIHYGENLEKANELGERLKQSLNVRKLTLSELTPVLGIHTGPELFAFVARRVSSKVTQ